MKNNIRPAGNAPAKPLTEAQKKAHVMQVILQKRENFAINILCNLIRGAASNAELSEEGGEGLVKLSVKMADNLIGELYPLPEENKDKEGK